MKSLQLRLLQLLLLLLIGDALMALMTSCLMKLETATRATRAAVGRARRYRC